MFVIHGQWLLPSQPQDSGRFILWAETSDEKLKKPRGRPRIPTHAFALSPERLTETLETLVPRPRTSPTPFTVILPALKSLPLPSPRLAHDWGEFRDASPTGLRRFKLEGLSLEPAGALHLLNKLPAPSDLPPRLALGDDLLFWVTAARFALEMLAAQRYLPSIERVGTQTFQARWRPIFDRSDDAARLSRLLRAMPPAARACLPIELTGPLVDPAPAHRLLEDFLTTMIDAAVREWHGPHWSRLPGDDVAAAWLNALFAADPTIAGPYFSLSALTRAHKTWVRQLQAAGDANFRATLRLGVPDRPQEPWPLDFLLQAKDDPSLLVEAKPSGKPGERPLPTWTGALTTRKSAC